jgi:3-isopropylmalate/(R)-2-methylmalate dehydratase large subunit
MSAKTLYDKLWDDHLVKQRDDGSCLIYIDRQLLHEVTSPQAFDGLKLANRQPWRLDANIATPDHNVPTDKDERSRGIAGIKDETSRIQVQTLDDNCKAFGVVEFDIFDERQGIVHVVGPEQGLTLPGMTVVCGDSHTATHGAFACLAHGIGTSEVEHVLATQCLVQKKSKNMLVKVDGVLGEGVTAKDVVLAIIGKIGTAGGTGYAIEFGGQVFRDMSMEGRMTVCNMAIEAGARVGMVAVDDKTIAYFDGKPFAPKGEQWDAAVTYWKTLVSDADAKFDAIVELDGNTIAPQVSWGTSPEMVLPITANLPALDSANDAVQRNSWERAYQYMGLAPQQAITDIKLDRVFIGSCTNSRIEDLRSAAAVIKGRKVASSIKQAMVVAGSGLVKKQAEAEGLDKVFLPKQVLNGANRVARCVWR